MGASLFVAFAGNFANSAAGTVVSGALLGGIVAGLNHYLHKIETTNKIRSEIDKYYNDKSVADASVKEGFLNDLAKIFPEIYELTAKNFTIANEGNLKQFNESTGEDYVLIGKTIVSNGGNGENINGITSMKDGRVLISPHRTRTALGFAATWYHEGVHSLHLITGIFETWKIRYGAKEAIRITEFYAHSMTDAMSGLSMTSSPAFSRYYPSLYIQSLSSFLRP